MDLKFKRGDVGVKCADGEWCSDRGSSGGCECDVSGLMDQFLGA